MMTEQELEDFVDQFAVEPIYYCDYNRRGRCGESIFCSANGGPCRSTKKTEWAKRDRDGNPIENKEDFKNEGKLEGTV